MTIKFHFIIKKPFLYCLFFRANNYYGFLSVCLYTLLCLRLSSLSCQSIIIPSRILPWNNTSSSRYNISNSIFLDSFIIFHFVHFHVHTLDFNVFFLLTTCIDDNQTLTHQLHCRRYGQHHCEESYLVD